MGIEDFKAVNWKGVFPTNVDVVVTEEFGDPVMLRCYHARADVRTVMKALLSLVEEGEKSTKVASALLAGDVGFAVLCQTPQARDAICKQVAESRLLDYRFLVEWAPGSAGMARYLKENRNRDK